MAKRDEASLESKESTSVQSVAVHQEVPTEEAAVKMIGVLKNRSPDLYLDVGRRRRN
jgi:hypothetical protein